MRRAEALERYRELPVPGTTEEHWRFTDLRGFDPEHGLLDGRGHEVERDELGVRMLERRAGRGPMVDHDLHVCAAGAAATVDNEISPCAGLALSVTDAARAPGILLDARESAPKLPMRRSDAALWSIPYPRKGQGQGQGVSCAGDAAEMVRCGTA